MGPVERVSLIGSYIGLMVGVCFQNLCMTIGFGFMFAAVAIRKWDR